MITQTGIVTTDADAQLAVSWKAIFAGATASAALTLVLVAFGVGVGFSVISPWSGEGISATTFSISAGIYLIVIAMLSSTIGGYLAGRLRTQWSTVHEYERYFRDSAHGFLVWSVATVFTAAILGGAMTSIIGATGAGLGAAATGAATGAATSAQSSATTPYVDRLLRPAANANTAGAPSASSPAQAAQSATEQATSPVAAGENAPNLQGGHVGAPPAPRGNADRAELGRVIATALTKGGTVSDADRSYLAQVVANQTGLSQQEAQQRVDQTIVQAKAAADAARKSGRNFAFWLTFAMLAGALSASLAAIEGGRLRNREWYLTEAERARLHAGNTAIAAE